MKFKTRNVKFIWNKKLEGKKGYVANNINELIEIMVDFIGFVVSAIVK